MSISSIRKQYNVPAKIGDEVIYFGDNDLGHRGRIVGTRDMRLRIVLDGQHRAGSYHPTWCIEYTTTPHQPPSPPAAPPHTP